MRIWMLLAVLAIAGCGRQAAKKTAEPIPLDKLPPAAMEAATKAAREKLPGVTLEQAYLKKEGVYEITGKSKTGKIHDVEVTAAGEVLEVE
jgi:hypothetical protein